MTNTDARTLRAGSAWTADDDDDRADRSAGPDGDDASGMHSDRDRISNNNNNNNMTLSASRESRDGSRFNALTTDDIPASRTGGFSTHDVHATTSVPSKEQRQPASRPLHRSASIPDIVVNSPECQPSVNPTYRQLHCLNRMAFSRFFEQPWSVQWQTALVRLPRAVPTSILRYTSPIGPHPFILNLPSRDQKRKIPLYIFVPSTTHIEAAAARNPKKSDDILLPVMIDFHGGGFFMGSALEQAPWCAKMARELGAVVLSVDYRMGPIDKFPAAHEDAEDVLAAVVDTTGTAPGANELREAVRRKVLADLKATKNVRGKVADRAARKVELDVSRIGSSGFSSGGNLTLNLALSTAAFDAQKTYDMDFNETDATESATRAAQWPTKLPRSHRRGFPLLIYYPSLDCRALPSERPLPEVLQLEADERLARKSRSRRSSGSRTASRGRKGDVGESSRDSSMQRTLGKSKSRSRLRRAISSQALRRTFSSQSLTKRGGTSNSSKDTLDSSVPSLTRSTTTTSMLEYPSAASSSRMLAPSPLGSSEALSRSFTETTLPTVPQSPRTPAQANAQAQANGPAHSSSHAHVPNGSTDYLAPPPSTHNGSAIVDEDEDEATEVYEPAEVQPPSKPPSPTSSEAPSETLSRASSSVRGPSKPLGFWSNLGDTLYTSYLPREHAAHPRASPGLAPLEGLHPAARLQLVLAQRDALSVQGEEWARKIRAEPDVAKRAKFETLVGNNVSHGWTQMPQSILSVEQLRERDRVWDVSVEYVRKAWAEEQ